MYYYILWLDQCNASATRIGTASMLEMWHRGATIIYRKKIDTIFPCHPRACHMALGLRIGHPRVPACRMYWEGVGRGGLGRGKTRTCPVAESKPRFLGLHDTKRVLVPARGYGTSGTKNEIFAYWPNLITIVSPSLLVCKVVHNALILHAQPRCAKSTPCASSEHFKKLSWKVPTSDLCCKRVLSHTGQTRCSRPRKCCKHVSLVPSRGC